MENDDIREFAYGNDTLVLNMCNMHPKEQTRFLQMYNNAVRNDIDGLEFVKVWNEYAQDIDQHVFWKIHEQQKKFVERG